MLSAQSILFLSTCAFLRNENYETAGAFANYTFETGKKVAIESGLRADYVFGEKLFVLPRASVLFKWTNKLTTRVVDFESLISAPYSTPQFTEVWAPLDGFVINAGIKIRL